ncbi:chromosome segregation protein SMC [Lentilactobacillus kisonensis]|nr:chromosome segregation protein SMC [Lentilactobacillus kisonensis]
MQLKSIEMIGFKSFADKTRIDFPGGMTGIVGPNGSGKSNIAEAIRWVMGEQSAKNLRGSRMPDVIFSGSADRRSLSMASVTLTLDNTDHYIDTPADELLISRKLFRNGDSSYFINNKQCRLRDVTDLFMDSGIGQGSLSIISQGNVEEIFNSKPIERRSIIENVAGVYKYKQHKLTAQREIDETADNLSRVEDIVHELKVRLQPLEEQSSLATDYLDQKKRLDGLVKQQLIISTANLAQRVAHSKALVAEKQAIVTKLSGQVSAGEQQRAVLKKQLANGREQIDDLNSQLLTVSNKIQSLNSQHQLTAQEKSFKNADLNRLNEQIKLTQSQIDDYKVKSEQANAEQKQLAGQLDEATAELEKVTAKEKQNSVSAIEQRIDDLRNHYVDLLQAQTDVKNQITERAHDNQRSQERSAAQQARVNKASRELTQLTAQAQDLDEQLQKSEHQFSETQVKLSNLEGVLNHNKQVVDRNQANWLAALKVAEQAKAKADSLKQLHDSYRGFYRGVSNLLRHKEQLTGILGPVSDYLDVANQYVKAVNTALGGQVQHVVVTNNASASAAIQYLTENRLGRVTLLPISTISGRHLNSDVIRSASTVPGYVGIASDLVSMPTKLTKIKEFLLGTTIIAKRLDNAIAISKAIHHRTRIVTLDGQVVNAGGSLTGGANRSENQGVLIQKTELESLTKSTQEMDRQLSEKEKALASAKSELAKIEDSYNRGRQQVFELKQQYESKRVQRQDMTKQVSQKQRELQTLKLAINNSTNNLESADQGDLNAKNQSLQIELDRTNGQLSEQKAQLTNVKKLTEQLSLSRQRYHDKVVVTKQKLAQIGRRQTEFDDQIKSHQLSLADLHKQWTAQTDALNETMAAGELNAQINQQTSRQDHLKAELEKVKQQINNDDEKLESVSQAVQTNQLNLNNATHEHQETLAQLKQDQQKLQADFDQLQANYHIAPGALKAVESDIDVDHVNRQIKMLRKGIDEIGPVNISAIQEFKDVSKRYDFLIKQRQDLVDAKDHLTATMADMDSTISVKFNSAFRAVAEAFSKVFVEMFGGGEAKLVLTDPDNLLTTGIEIMVKPPGKNYRNLSLLSGGEKALTAITLLFAIIKVRPVPFCILDEAEAALDPFNADRFAKYLKRFEDETQFVVITHRKETMIYADQLYGVTMQESGVSKVVTVNLDNLQTEVS